MKNMHSTLAKQDNLERTCTHQAIFSFRLSLADLDSGASSVSENKDLLIRSHDKSRDHIDSTSDKSHDNAAESLDQTNCRTFSFSEWDTNIPPEDVLDQSHVSNKSHDMPGKSRDVINESHDTFNQSHDSFDEAIKQSHHTYIDALINQHDDITARSNDQTDDITVKSHDHTNDIARSHDLCRQLVLERLLQECPVEGSARTQPEVLLRLLDQLTLTESVVHLRDEW